MIHLLLPYTLFFYTTTAPTEIYTLSLHDALPISRRDFNDAIRLLEKEKELGALELNDLFILTYVYCLAGEVGKAENRSEEHTSELQSRFDLVCRLLLEKKKKKRKYRKPS